MTYVPLTHAEAVELRAGKDLGPRPACANTPSLRSGLGPQTTADEADFVTLTNAGVLGLVVNGEPLRLVTAVEVDPAQLRDGHSADGEVEVTGLRWSRVKALFADEDPGAREVAAAVAAARFRGLADALALPAVLTMLDTHDLLWFAVDELDELS
jgi:hypothetical protein